MEKSNENDFNKLPSAVAKVYDVVNKILLQLADINKFFETIIAINHATIKII